MAQVGQYAQAHLPKWLDEPSRLAQFASLHVHPVASFWRKTDCDLIGPHLTSGNLPVPPIVSCTRIITDGVCGHDPEIIGRLGPVYAQQGTFSYFRNREVAKLT